MDTRFFVTGLRTSQKKKIAPSSSWLAAIAPYHNSHRQTFSRPGGSYPTRESGTASDWAPGIPSRQSLGRAIGMSRTGERLRGYVERDRSRSRANKYRGVVELYSPYIPEDVVEVRILYVSAIRLDALESGVGWQDPKPRVRTSTDPMTSF